VVEAVIKMVLSIHILLQEINFKSTKIVYGWGSSPDPAGRAYDAPPDPLIGFVQALRALGSRASRARYWGALHVLGLCKIQAEFKP
jgi:hypothetical protein